MKTRLFIMAAMFATVLCGCTKENDLKKQIVGTWEYYLAETYGSDGSYYAEDNSNSNEYTIKVYNKDGSLVCEDKEMSIYRGEGTYELENSVLKEIYTKNTIINEDGSEETIIYDEYDINEYEIHFEGDDVLVLTWTDTYQDVTFTYKEYYRRR